MIGRRARVHQQYDFALLVTYGTKRGNSGTRRSPALNARRGVDAVIISSDNTLV